MTKPHKFDGRPWWDTGPEPLHHEDGTRIRHRIDYRRLPIEPFRDYRWMGVLFAGVDAETRLKALKRHWRRLRTGYFDRHDPLPPFNYGRQPEPLPRCGAKCRDGSPCRARVVQSPVTGEPSNRCRMHGGHSTGPKTEEGRRRSLEALARGRATRSRRSARCSQTVSRTGTVPPTTTHGVHNARSESDAS